MSLKSFTLMVTVAFSFSCGGNMGRRRTDPTLDVTNFTGSRLLVLVDGRRLGRIYGQHGCLRMSHLQQGFNTLSFQPLAEGPTDAPAVPLASAPGWEITIGMDLRRDVVSLQPTFEPCKVR